MSPDPFVLLLAGAAAAWTYYTHLSRKARR